jgi:hypothetical protein
MKHSLQPQEEEESDLIVRLSHDTHDGVPSTEIGASTYLDKHNEI